MKPVKRVALLHDLCAVGKAALTNMMPILSVMGIEACPIPTMLLSTHTGGYGKPAITKTENAYLYDCARHFREQQIRFDGIFVGYLGNREIISACEAFLEYFPEVPVIFDPIMGDNGSYYSNFDSSYCEEIKRLLKRSDIIIPNLTEACLLCQTPYCEEMGADQLRELCQALCVQMKPEGKVILTSAPAPDGERAVTLYQNQTAEQFFFPSCGGHYHGTGDVFDGVFTAAWMQGKEISECVRMAHEFTARCIQTSSRYVYPERDGLLLETCLPALFEK